MLNASREISKFEGMLQDRTASIQPQQVRSIILKYSLLTATADEEEKLFAGKLGQHRDWRQAVHLVDASLGSIRRASSPQLDKLREWLFYRKVRILSEYNPQSIETTIRTFEGEYPKSSLLDDAYAELLKVQAFQLHSKRAIVDATFRLIVERFPGENAVDNAYNWYAIYLEQEKDFAARERSIWKSSRNFLLRGMRCMPRREWRQAQISAHAAARPCQLRSIQVARNAKADEVLGDIA